MNGYVPKPFSVSELMIAIPQALGKKSYTTSAKNETDKQDNLTLLKIPASEYNLITYISSWMVILKAWTTISGY